MSIEITINGDRTLEIIGWFITSAGLAMLAYREGIRQGKKLGARRERSQTLKDSATELAETEKTEALRLRDAITSSVSITRTSNIPKLIDDDEYQVRDEISRSLMLQSCEDVLAPPHKRAMRRGQLVKVEMEPGKWVHHCRVSAPPQKKGEQWLVGVRGLIPGITSVVDLHKLEPEEPRR